MLPSNCLSWFPVDCKNNKLGTIYNASSASYKSFPQAPFHYQQAKTGYLLLHVIGFLHQYNFCLIRKVCYNHKSQNCQLGNVSETIGTLKLPLTCSTRILICFLQILKVQNHSSFCSQKMFQNYLPELKYLEQSDYFIN